jgi:hypothetical protein
MTQAQPARCVFHCSNLATNQALYRKRDGSHFLGDPTCEFHKYPLGRPRFAQWVEIVDYISTAPTNP